MEYRSDDSSELPEGASILICSIGGNNSTGVANGFLQNLSAYKLVSDTTGNMGPEDGILLGRDPKCEIILDNPLVSRVHAQIFSNNEGTFIKDRQSKNGTYLNGSGIGDGDLLVKLEHGDVLELGSECRIMFQKHNENLREFHNIFESEFQEQFPIYLTTDNLISLHSFTENEFNMFTSVDTLDAIDSANNQKDTEEISFPLIEGDIDGFLDLKVPYLMLGWWGHGFNSYAFYYQEISTNLTVWLRIPWGGVYSDPESDRVRLLDLLNSFNTFKTKYSPRSQASTLVHSVGSGNVICSFPQYRSEPFEGIINNAADLVRFMSLLPDIEQGK